jgi:D-alanyl-D-alanine carboxypeptidase/D-alanyl-D-alanine-endopeptidase (penicillin-binding protein 4)
MKFTATYSTQCFLVAIITCWLFSCSINKELSKQANRILLKDSAISAGHIGISIFEPATGKYLYNYNGDKYFIPASNTKLFSLYAGMKYLGDSLVGMKITITNDALIITPTGDPTLLHPDFERQPVVDFLRKQTTPLFANLNLPTINGHGRGWAWDDYDASYMNERSAMPVFGNSLVVTGTASAPTYFPKRAVDHLIAKNNADSGYIKEVSRSRYSNDFSYVANGKKSSNIVIPFISSLPLAFDILEDTIHQNIQPAGKTDSTQIIRTFVVHSQPSDSLFKPMMKWSDNFFAEQTLLMASNEKLGYMSDGDMIDYLLKNDLKAIPQLPKWVDGSGLSRYNLFTPQSFVYVLNQLKQTFDFDRIKNILPTGGEGTLSSYYKTEAGFIFAKTGTLSNNCSLSGYLITKKNKLLVFSILANNYQTSATPVRKAVEEFLRAVRERY